MKYGIFILGDKPPGVSHEEVFRNVLEEARWADELGFDAVWLAEHHFSPYGTLANLPVVAAAIAGATERVRIGTACIVAPFHNPIEVAEQIAMVDVLSGGRFDAGWDVLRQKRYARMVEMGLIDPRWGLSPRDGNVPAWADAPDKAWQLRRMEVYAAQVDRMDRGIGRIVDRLKAHGALDNTLILFLSDNGGCHEELAASWDNYFVGNREKVMRPTTRDGRAVQHTNDPAVMPGPSDTYQSYGYPWANVSNTPFRLFKHWEHEGGISTPLIAHWPAAVQARGDLRRQHGHVIDIMATCVDVAGATFPAAYAGRATTPLEGRSLAPALDDRAIVRDELCWEHEGNRALLTDHWKLVARGAKGPWELYDIAADRTELNDLAATRADVVSDLSRRWDAWAARTGVLPRPGQAN